MSGVAPLEGVRVVEVAGWMAAPGAAAVLGQHTLEVLLQLAMSDAELDAAVADGLVGTGA